MHYTKMHGAGNSFLLVENLHDELQGEDPGILALRLCNPKTGSGADGLIMIVPADSPADFGMHFYNSDGSVGEMCGNGARCLSRYGVEHGLCSDPDHICILTAAGLVFGRRISQERYEIRLNDPSVIDLARQTGGIGGLDCCFYVELGSPGIPHAVVLTDADAFEDLDTLRERGRALRHSSVFPKGANVTFVAPLSESVVRAITFERGVENFTLACGTGSGAVAVCLILGGIVSGNPITVRMPGGDLSVRLTVRDDTVSDILLTGQTAVVEQGEFSL